MSVAIVPDDPLLREPGHQLELTWRSSRHARRLLTLSLAGAVIALLTGRPEFAGVAAPGLLLLAAGRLQRRPARIVVRVRLSAGRALEGEAVTVEVRSEGHGDRHVRWILHPGAAINPGDVTTADGAQARFTLAAEHWGRRRVGTMSVVVRDPWRLAEGHLSVILPVLDFYPGPTNQRTTVVLRRLPTRVGEHPARTAGQGIEFFGVREYLPGDRQRSINWPASTRRGRLQVNTFATERSQDVVLLADATSDVGEPGSSALDLALRGASSGRLPRAALPPGALIVVFSPLLDQRFVETLRNMRERGFTMLVVDVLNAEPPARRRNEDRMTRQIWQMEKEAIRFSLHELGVPVVHWDGVASLDLPLAGYVRRPLAARR